MILKEYSTIDEPSMGSNRMPNRQEVKKIRKMFLVSYVSKTSISDTVLLVLWDS